MFGYIHAQRVAGREGSRLSERLTVGVSEIIRLCNRGQKTTVSRILLGRVARDEDYIDQFTFHAHFIKLSPHGGQLRVGSHPVLRAAYGNNGNDSRDEQEISEGDEEFFH